jgi:hypothetical protein
MILRPTGLNTHERVELSMSTYRIYFNSTRLMRYTVRTGIIEPAFGTILNPYLPLLPPPQHYISKLITPRHPRQTPHKRLHLPPRPLPPKTNTRSPKPSARSIPRPNHRIRHPSHKSLTLQRPWRIRQHTRDPSTGLSYQSFHYETRIAS